MNTPTRIDMRIRSVVCMVAFVSVLGYGQSSNVTCSFRSLTKLSSPVIAAMEINDVGAVVGGVSGHAQIEAPAFLFYQDKFTFFRFPRSMSSSANDINRRSEIVGEYIDHSGTRHGFAVRNGAFRSIDFPEASGTFAKGINNSGAIVGSYVDATDRSQAFLLYAGRFTRFSYPGAKLTFANRINDRSVIVGSYSDGTHTHGFQVKNGAFATVDVPGASDTTATAIDNAGNIVGFYSLNGISHGFVLTNGKFFTIDAPGAQGLNAGTLIWGINDLKEIVGFYTFGDDPTLPQARGYQADCRGVF